MSKQNLTQTPLSKKDFMVVEEMANEVLVYDTAKNKLHVLNPAAAAVWNHCDGKTGVSEIAGKLGAESDGRINEDLTWLALEELGKSGLMEGTVDVPQDHISRRAMIKKAAAAAALALPVVTTVIAPSPARAQSARSSSLQPAASRPLVGEHSERSGHSGRSRLSDRSEQRSGHSGRSRLSERSGRNVDDGNDD
ncbi:MAG: PqqD family protein [Blastocatellia bacterium]